MYRSCLRCGVTSTVELNRLTGNPEIWMEVSPATINYVWSIIYAWWCYNICWTKCLKKQYASQHWDRLSSKYLKWWRGMQIRARVHRQRHLRNVLVRHWPHQWCHHLRWARGTITTTIIASIILSKHWTLFTPSNGAHIKQHFSLLPKVQLKVLNAILT